MEDDPVLGDEGSRTLQSAQPDVSEGVAARAGPEVQVRSVPAEPPGPELPQGPSDSGFNHQF